MKYQKNTLFQNQDIRNFFVNQLKPNALCLASTDMVNLEGNVKNTKTQKEDNYMERN